MMAFDVNVLVYAHRVEYHQHEKAKKFIETLVNGPGPFGFSVLVASGFVRIATNAKIHRPATSLATALDVVETLRRRKKCFWITPGPQLVPVLQTRITRHWHLRRAPHGPALMKTLVNLRPWV
jgi:uncharacterized protein